MVVLSTLDAFIQGICWNCWCLINVIVKNEIRPEMLLFVLNFLNFVVCTTLLYKHTFSTLMTYVKNCWLR